jgi:hypothetical protein
MGRRSVLVTTAAITAALRHAYGMERVLPEIRRAGEAVAAAVTLIVPTNP